MKKKTQLDREKQFEKLYSTLEQSWDTWTRLFNIIVIICGIHVQVIKVYEIVMHSSSFDMSQIITIILNNLQLIRMSQLC